MEGPQCSTDEQQQVCDVCVLIGEVKEHLLSWSQGKKEGEGSRDEYFRVLI
jgi:hypothetical protein